MALEQTLRMACGWLELGLVDEALFELEGLPADQKTRPEVLELKLAAQMSACHWNAAADTSRMLCMQDLKQPVFFLKAAFCLHETGDTVAACQWLMKGPRALYEMPIFHYNIACYLWALDDKQRARTHLSRALAMDEGLRHVADRDADFSALPLMP